MTRIASYLANFVIPGAFVASTTFAAVILSTSTAFAEPTASVSISPATIALDSTATITLDISYEGSGEAKFESQPDFGKLRVVGHSTMPTYMNINGQESRRLQVQYSVRASDVGTFKIHFPAILVAGKRLRTQEKILKVVEPNDAALKKNNPQNQALGTDSDNYSLDVAISPQRNPYVGEQVLLSYIFNRRYSAPSVQISSPSTPDFDNFWVENFESQGSPQSRLIRTKTGIVEQVPIQQFAIFPLNAGRAKIDPVTLQVFQTSFFSRGEQQEVTSRGIDLDVQPLPPDAPPGFQAVNVGKYKFSVSTPSTKSKVGLPTNIVLKVSGEGYIDRVAVPALPDIDNIQVSNKTEKTEREPSLDRVVGSKNITYTVIPTKPGVLKIPEMTFVYFDPDDGKYKTNTSKPIQMVIEPGVLPDSLKNGTTKLPSKPSVASTEDETLIQDIFDDLKAPISFKSDESKVTSPFTSWWFYLLCLIPLLGLIAISGAPLVKGSFRKKKDRRFDRKASKALKEKLEAASTSSDIQEVLRELFVSLLNLAPGEVTSAAISDPLRKRGFNDDFIETVVEVFKRLESARFSREFADHPPESLKSTVEGIIDDASKNAAPKRKFRLYIPIPVVVFVAAVLLAIAFLSAMNLVCTDTSCGFLGENGAVQKGENKELDEKLEKAIDLYEKNDFAGASAIWNDALKPCGHNPILLYNLATGEARQLQFGKARLHIERAGMLAPLNRTIAEQRSVIGRMVRRRSIENSVKGETLSGDEPLFWWHLASQLYPPLLATLIAVGLWVAFLSAIVRCYTNKPAFRDTVLVTMVLGLIIFIGSGAVYIGRIIVFSEVTPAVLMKEKVLFRSGPSTYASEVSMPENAVPGTVVRIERSQDGWEKVVFPTGDKGWTNEGIEKILSK